MALPHIAIGGRMQAGKTTCAEYLAARYGYTRYALADPIKEIARQEFGWDGAKDDRGRRLLQQLGSAGRAYEPRVWLRRFEDWFSSHSHRPVVVDDLRLVDEAAFFKRRGFLTILVVRPGHSAPDGDPSLCEHPTETEIDSAPLDLVIMNAGTIPELHGNLEHALERWLSGSTP
jgi:hypothetical protein